MNEKSYNFQKLTPTDQAKLRVYDEALNFVFDNDDVKNVAISGAYGAGKSSMIETYKKNNPDIHFLHISLAHFESIEPSDSKSPRVNEAVLEGKILNQLIHQIKPDKIPKTNFKVKQEISLRKTFRVTIITIVFLILVGYNIFFQNWFEFVTGLSNIWLRNLLEWTIYDISFLLSGIACLVIAGFAIYTTIKTQSNKNIFRKVNVQGTEIEIFEKNDESYFDKYLNEVLYLFENSGADVIVFEDMDRYNINQIFERLREVNTLVNNQRLKERKTPIRFFYLLRDDIFISKDRTKFFDFIVPIVPVIDGSNSYDKFIAHFEQGEIIKLFDENFLQGLSLYVDDMRILKNIYNEFIIYHEYLDSIELNNNKLLAIIAYKNIFPRDFSDLQLGMGFVHNLFNSKNELVREEVKRVENEIQVLDKRIQQARSEILNDIDELDTLYLVLDYYNIAVNEKNQSSFHTRTQFIKAMKDKPSSVTYFNTAYSSTSNLNFSDT